MDFCPEKNCQSFRHMDVKGLGVSKAFQGTSYSECSKDPKDPHRWDPIWGGEQRAVGVVPLLGGQCMDKLSGIFKC